MPDKNDMDSFLDAIENMPSDIFRAKFEGGNPPEPVQRIITPESPFDETIDLHGFNRQEAITILRTALTRARGKRLKMLVITGKGSNSDDGRGIIRETVMRYLRKAGSRYVREFHFASRQNGGDGAVEIITR